MSIIEFKAPERNTKAHVVSISGVKVYFSYDTPVGCNPPNDPSFQRDNVWGPTTGKHLSAWGFNTPGVEKLAQEEFERRMTLTIYKAMAERVTAKIGA